MQSESMSGVSYIFVQSSSALNVQEPSAIPHLEWTGTRFEQQAPLPSPKLRIMIEVITDSKLFPMPVSFPPEFRPTSATTMTLADSGAQTCSGDLDLLSLLGCSVSDLLPTSHGIRGVTNTFLQLLGVLPVRITAKSRHTNQIMYFAKNTRGCLLSEKALRDLHILPKQFPSVVHSAVSRTFVPDGPKAKCGCLKRCPPPNLPTMLPFPATTKRIPDLDKFIRCFFMASAFNSCTHQPLPAMTGEEMTVTLRKDAKPFAVHCPIPIPLHWESEVLAQIWNDVALGIIEPVPSTTPTVWCSRMVVIPKKEGTP